MKTQDSEFWSKYYLDLDDVVIIQGQSYYKLRLLNNNSLYKKKQVCAYIATPIAHKIHFSGDVSFFPDPNNKQNIPMIKGGKGSRLEIKDCHIEGRVVIDLKKKSSLYFEKANVSGNDGVVYIGSSSVERKDIKNCNISGRWITIQDTDIEHYDIQGTSISLTHQSLLGEEKKNNFIVGEKIEICCEGEDICVLERTNIDGKNIEIKNDSTVVGATIKDGTLIDNSEVVCDGGELILNNATIIEGSRVVSFGDRTNIEDSSIKNSDITLGGNIKNAKLKDKDKGFEIVKSVVSECTGDMPQKTKDSICEKCNNICQYKNVEQCEMVGEGFETPLFGNILKRFGIDKAEYYVDEVYKKYITPHKFYDLDEYHKLVAKASTENNKESQTDNILLSR